MSNVIDFLSHKSNDVNYIVGQVCGEFDVVGVQCDEISIQMTPCGERVMLGSSFVSKDELLAFLLCTGLYDEFKQKVG